MSMQYPDHPNNLFNNNYRIDSYRMQRIRKHLQTLFANHAKVTVIRLDFYVQPEYRELVTAQYMTERWTQFRNNKRTNALFDHLITYITKLEYGERRGWHLHTVLFFDGQYVWQDGTMALAIAAYWRETINRTIGQAYSRNLDKDSVDVCPLGLLHYSETERIRQLEQVLSYLAKEDGSREAAWDTGENLQRLRQFNTGQIKTKNEGWGRPRKHHRPCSNNGIGNRL